MQAVKVERAGPFPTDHLDPAVLATPGLLIFGTTALVVAMYDADIFHPETGTLVLLTLCGGLGQILAAARDWSRRNLFSATIFASYGLFWLSLIPLVILPRAGEAASPQSQALAAYLAVWGLFSIVVFRAFTRRNRALRLMFGFLVSFLLLSATGAATQNAALGAAAGYGGILFGIDALVVGLLQNRPGKGR